MAIDNKWTFLRHYAGDFLKIKYINLTFFNKESKIRLIN